jgi:bacterioferritin-associated ferredoxin
MIVCVCNALRERDCREAAGDPGVRRAGCVYRRLNCRVRCGACVQTMKAIVDELRDERAARQASAQPAEVAALPVPAE